MLNFCVLKLIAHVLPHNIHDNRHNLDATIISLCIQENPSLTEQMACALPDSLVCAVT